MAPSGCVLLKKSARLTWDNTTIPNGGGFTVSNPHGSTSDKECISDTQHRLIEATTASDGERPGMCRERRSF